MNQFKTLVSTDNHQFSCYLTQPEQANKGCIILVHEIFGITPQMKELAQQYVNQGFTVAIPALFDRIEKNVVIAYDEPEKGLAIVAQCKKDELLRDIEAVIEHFNGQQVSIIGFCWGGGLAYLAASTLSIYSGASFYGTRLESYLPNIPKCEFQFHFGGLDSHSPQHVIDNMQVAAPDCQFYIYPEVGHAFANHHKPSFDLKAHELSMERILTMLKR